MQREDMILTSTLEVTEDLYRSFQHHHPLHPSSSTTTTKSTISKSSPGFSLNHHQPSTTTSHSQPRENEEDDDDNADDRSFDRFLQYSSTSGSNKGRFGNDDLLEDTAYVFKGNYHGSENKVKRDHMDEKMNNYLNLILSHVQASHYRKCFCSFIPFTFFLNFLLILVFVTFFVSQHVPPFHVICLCDIYI
jgi:hypothetical protein